jgi:hypothetical protein
MVAYGYYFEHTRQSVIKPNRWSWLLFALSSVLESLTYDEIAEGTMATFAFYLSAACTIVVTSLIWSRGKWEKPNAYERFSFVAAVTAMLLYWVFQKAGWAHAVLLISIPVTFIPSYKDAWYDWKEEDTPAWKLWTMGDGLVLLLVLLTIQSPEELPYALVELGCHAAMWAIVSVRKRASGQ